MAFVDGTFVAGVSVKLVVIRKLQSIDHRPEGNIYYLQKNLSERRVVVEYRLSFD